MAMVGEEQTGNTDNKQGDEGDAKIVKFVMEELWDGGEDIA